MEEIITKYFEAWNSRNIEALSNLFDERIILTDWETKAQGISEVIEVNKKIFISAPKIRAEIIDSHSNQKYTYIKLLIHIDDHTKLNVMDLIKIEDGKIVSISAYRQ